ncbi:MAG: hypothetical protein AAF845_02740 [Bacteroidota bacterium]
MSEYIGHVIVAKDMLRVARRWGRVSRPLVGAVEAAPHAAWLGSGSGGGRHGIGPLAEALRGRVPFRGDDVTRAAFLFGWTSHQAADGYFKAVYRNALAVAYNALPDHAKSPPADVAVVHDVVLMRERMDGGREAPFAPSIFDYRLESEPAASVLDVPSTEAAFGMQAQREAFARMSDASRGAGGALADRLEGYFRRLDPFYVPTDRYAKAAHDPDPEQLRRFVHDVRFYDPDDAVFAIADGEGPLPDADVEAALAAADARGSLYARVVAVAARFAVTLGDVLEGRADLDALGPILEAQPGEDQAIEAVYDASL